MSRKNNKSRIRNNEKYQPLFKKLENTSLKEYLTCGVCGKKFKNLIRHVNTIHEMTADEYRAEVPDTEYFFSDDSRVKKSKNSLNWIREKKRYITEGEIEFVRENYTHMTSGELAQKLDLPRRSIDNIVLRFVPELKPEGVLPRLRKPKPLVNSGREWSEKEKEYLRKHYRTKSLRELASCLGRTVSAVEGRISQLGLERKTWREWTDEELAFLKENINTLTHQELSEKLGHGVFTIKTKTEELGLTKVPCYHPLRNWSEDEIQYLKENWEKKQLNEICRYLKRSKKAIKTAQDELGLPCRRIFKLTDRNIEYIIRNYPHDTAPNIAQKLGVSCVTVRKYIEKLGIQKTG